MLLLNNQRLLSYCWCVISFFISFTVVASPFYNAETVQKEKQPSQQAILLNESFLHKAVLTDAVLHSDIRQLVVVIVESEHAITGDLLTFEKQFDKKSKTQLWRSYTISTKVVVGKNGIAWGKGLHPKQQGLHKKEGDGKAPSGVFTLGSAFGYLPSVDTQLAYTQMSEDDYCIDVNESPYYNQIIAKADVGAASIQSSSEPMRRDIHLKDNLYKKGVVIGHNTENISAAGSCIFMHIWRDSHKPTAGCTAMAEVALDQLLKWLDKDQQPAFVLLTKAQYLSVQQHWQLPVIDFSVPIKL